MSRVELKEWSKDQIKGNMGNIWIGVGIVFVITFLFSFASGFISGIFGEESIITFVVSLAIELLLVPLSVGFNAYMMGFVKNREFNRDTIFASYEDAFKVIGTNILMSVIIIIGMIFFIVPGIYLILSYSLVPYLLVTRRDLSITETLELSRKMMNGHKLDYFILGFSFIGWMFLTPFTLGILLIWLYPYMMTAMTKFAVDVIDNYEE